MSGRGRYGIALAGALALVAATSAWAGVKATPASDTPGYDARHEYVIKATVAAIKPHKSVMGYDDMHVVLTTTIGDMEVHLGPVVYLARHGVELKPGDQVVVVGCKTTWEDQPVIVARLLTAGGKELKLRDDRGKPAWPKNLSS